jgi:hypothetical protein
MSVAPILSGLGRCSADKALQRRDEHVLRCTVNMQVWPLRSRYQAYDKIGGLFQIDPGHIDNQMI